MRFIPQEPNTFGDQASHEEALVDNTSSQILISREIADPTTIIAAPVSITSTVESSAQHSKSLQGVPGLTRSTQSDEAHERVVSEARPHDAESTEIQGGYLGQRGSFGGSIYRASSGSRLSSQSSATSPASALASLLLIPGTPDIGAPIERGRTLHKRPQFENPLARAESKAGRAEALIELNSIPIGKRLSRSSTFFDDPTDICAVLDDNLLEPCPHLLPCANVTAVLNHSSSEKEHSSFRISPKPPSSHASDHAFTFPILSFPVKTVKSQSAENQGSLASQLPTELIQQIYYSLSPADFNSARHTCRSWFTSSLERSLLHQMMKRGGFASGIQNNLKPCHDLPTYSVIEIDESRMSKLLSRECALGPDWKGNGLSGQGSTSPSAFSYAAFVDFTGISVQNMRSGSTDTLFTVSTCGKFLTAANGRLVYVYELNKSKNTGLGSHHEPGSLLPITCIICPARVIGCSVDTSSRRYAIAMLLEGRMGMVCDITSLSKSGLRTHIPQNGSDEADCSSKKPQDPSRLNVSSFLDRVSLNEFQSPSKPFIFPGIAVGGDPSWEDISFGNMTHSTQKSGISSRQGSAARLDVLKQIWMDKMPSSSSGSSLNSTWSVPIEDGPRSLYQNICSEDDPPRSVAICPQRRCVAFGCSNGIELHWVDALTGQDLNRWFPLTSPSDFLFFLPPRKSVDSAKKLRIISSAARPSERPAMATTPFGVHSQGNPLRKLGCGYETSDSTECATVAERAARSRAVISGVRYGQLNGRQQSADHYRAIPLSDGYHILFTDYISGNLFLGSDAPIGGPTKLLRKIWFQGPSGEASPTLYSGGSDLSCGVRVVAAFGHGSEQSIWLYSVPLDIFKADQDVPSTVVGSFYFKSKSNNEQEMEWTSWWRENVSQESPCQIGDLTLEPSQLGIWPVKIRGQEIGKCSELLDLAIDSGRSMTIWAFAKNGISTVWKTGNGNDGLFRERLVMRDGTIREKDGEGDIKMVDINANQSFEIGSNSSPEKVLLDGAAHFGVAQSAGIRKRRRV